MSNKKNTYIKMVNSSMDKHFTYIELNNLRDKALLCGDYISVMHYCYAMIEDRLLSFLHYLYIIDRNKYPYLLENKIATSITLLLYPNKKDDFCIKSKPNFNNINTKINVIKKIYNYSGKDIIILNMKNFINEIIDLNELKGDVKNLIEWKNFRNELVHSLYNKNLEDYNSKIKKYANIGISLANKFDNYSDLMKGNIINHKSFRALMNEINIK